MGVLFTGRESHGECGLAGAARGPSLGLCAPRCRPPTGRLLRLREFHRGHRRQRADALPLQPGDGDDASGLRDVSGRRLPHDDPAVSTGLEHAAF